MDARIDRELGDVMQANALVLGVGGIIRGLDHALLQAGEDLGGRQTDRIGAGAAEDLGGQPLGRAHLDALHVGDALDGDGRGEGFLGVRRAAHHLDALLGVLVEGFLEDVHAAALIAVAEQLPGRVVAGDEIAHHREHLVAAAEIDGGGEVALQDALAHGVDGLVVRHHGAAANPIDCHPPASQGLELGAPGLDMLEDGRTGGHRGLYGPGFGQGPGRGGDGHRAGQQNGLG